MHFCSRATASLREEGEEETPSVVLAQERTKLAARRIPARVKVDLVLLFLRLSLFSASQDVKKRARGLCVY